MLHIDTVKTQIDNHKKYLYELEKVRDKHRENGKKESCEIIEGCISNTNSEINNLKNELQNLNRLRINLN